MKTYAIYYMNADYTRDGSGGSKFLRQFGKMPNLNKLEATHTFLKVVEAESLSDVFRQMQGENWSPNGEARDLIKSRGLIHTSMSVGDIILDTDGATFYMVDRRGFTNLHEMH